ncbi:precorrin-3B C(17)-methyltransferase [Cucumibacter marinus]|uniref:precorrin-3B C(17)-methyltransferase n=1 Tax=Cucumibacter marinus TaxID=1121252 RepID=UPI0003FE86EB|nr:precorrin-3B C(17)-methyltransferase [Cucumibacter marinus]
MGLTPLVISLSAAGDATASRIAGAIGAELFAGSRAAVKEAIADTFKVGRPVIGVCAAGILIRLLATHLGDKHAEPPVIAVSPDGAHVVPLLGGHHGANRMAEAIAAALNGVAAVTTASDKVLGIALDEPPAGWVLAPGQDIKPLAARLLTGERIKLEGHAPWLAPLCDETGTVMVTVSEAGKGDGLVYVPQTLVVGVGCERGTEAGEIIALVEDTLAEEGLSHLALAAIATIDVKADEAGLIAAAEHFGVPLRLFTAEELAEERDRLPNPSPVVEAEVGTPGVSEAAALKAGALVVEKHKSKRATCAIGKAGAPVDPSALGRAPGHVAVVGIGPGDAAMRTPEVTGALRAAEDWVGYGLYLDLVSDLKRDQTEHRFDLGAEEIRVRHALELAATGKRVALVCSGDAGIYAMAALVFELLEATGERELSEPAKRVAVTVMPGISALQAAAARAGALIGHDFCAISLSDLLTPREDIQKRIRAAASGDFVTALYNPRSKRRTDLIEETCDVFLQHRAKDTPVILASSLGRPEEHVRIVPLGELDVTEIDMLTVVLIGSSQSRCFTRGDGKTVAFTPRGYARKAEKG